MVIMGVKKYGKLNHGGLWDMFGGLPHHLLDIRIIHDARFHLIQNIASELSDF